MWGYIEQKLHEARIKRESAEIQRTLLAVAPKCTHCDGDGEVRVRGVRTPTGYEMCYHCGGSGKDTAGDPK